MLSVVVAATEVVVVVTSRVFVDRVVGCSIHLTLHRVEVVGIDAVVAFVSIIQSIQTDILLRACAALVGEGINDRLFAGHTSPKGFDVGGGTIDGHSAFVCLLPVFQHILADVAQVEVEVTAISFVVLGVDKRVEHPELDVLDVAGFEVAHVDFPHHASPTLLGVVQAGILVHVGVKVVRTAFAGVVSYVQDVQSVAFSLVGVAVGIDFTGINFAYVVVGELFQVTLDVCWREGR